MSSLVRTFVIGLWAHPNLGGSHLKMLDLIASAKTLCPNKVTFTGSEWTRLNPLRDQDSAMCWASPSPLCTVSREPGWKLWGQAHGHLEESPQGPHSWPSPSLSQLKTDPKEPRPPSLREVSMSHSQGACKKGTSLTGRPKQATTLAPERRLHQTKMHPSSSTTSSRYRSHVG